MSIYKERADLKTAQLRRLLSELEKNRDALLDEVANKKGRADQIEQTIARVYELILDTNKEEQQKEAEEITRLAKVEQDRQATEKREQERLAFEEAKKGIKTPKRERPQR